MNKRHMRIERIKVVLQEYLAAKSAAALLDAKICAEPSYPSDSGWDQSAATAFADNLEATYLIRIFAEFEATLREYWSTYEKRTTRPPMNQLLNDAIPTLHFPRDRIDDADEVRNYRNFLVHEMHEEPNTAIAAITMQEANKRLCAYIAYLNPRWR